MSEKDAVFWRTNNPYRDVAREFERGIQVRHPGQFECRIGVGGHCPYCASSVGYPEYQGERLV